MSNYDQNKRMFCSFNYCGTETGRTTTQKLKPPLTLEPKGLAFQTLTKFSEVGADLRSMFVPDEGYVFVEADYSQIEARIVALFSNDEDALNCFTMYDRTKLPEYDIHRVTASWISGVAPKDIPGDSPDRQVGKSARYLGQYDGQKHRLALFAGISEWKAQKVLDIFHKRSPNIRDVFHAEIRRLLEQNNRVLINPYGRPRQFLNKWGDELFKEAYAALPQSTVPDHLKHAMFKIRKLFDPIEMQFVMESHDSFTALVLKCVLKRFIETAKPIMEAPIDFSKCSLSRGTLIVPAEFKVAKDNLQVMVSYKI